MARTRDSGRESSSVVNLSNGPRAGPGHQNAPKDEAPKVSGGDIEEATPDPIPNSEVKLLGADGTAREAVWESRTLPGFFPAVRRVSGRADDPEA